MKIVILGSGVVGVTSAWYLARAGHEVTVLDRQPAAGMETSFANAGQVSPGYSAPWAAPGLLVKAVKWLMMHHRPLVLWPMTDPRLWSWAIRLLANCTEEAYRTNKGRMVRIAEYSRDCAEANCAPRPGIAYDHREQGTLQLFRTQKQLDHVGDDTTVLDEYGVPYEVLDAAGCVARRAGARAGARHVRGRPPAAGRRDRRRACVHPTARGDCAAQAGVAFRYGVDDHARCGRGRPDRRRRDRRRGALPPTPTSSRWAASRPLLLRAARHPPADLSRERLLDHRCRSPTRRWRPSRR